ncbi:MAG: hypothetical protein ACREQM_02605 [Candidatus Dormibacteraceae bacterium]
MSGELLAQAVALLLFPGVVSILVFGLVVEGGARALLGAPDGRGLLREMRGGVRRLAPLGVGGALLLALGTTQVAVPLSPVPPGEHTLLVAIGALAAGGWLLWLLAGAGIVAGRILLLAQVTWAIALLAPALASGSLLPVQLGVTTLPPQVAARVAAGVAYLVALPGLLLLAEREDRFSAGGQVVRMLSWAPQTGLFASLVLPSLRANAAGVLLFALICVGASAVAVIVAVPLRRRPELLQRAYPRVLAALAFIALVLGILATYLP